MLSIPQFIIPTSVNEATEIQNKLKFAIKIEDEFKEINIIGGVDVGYDIKNNLAHSSIVIMDIKDLKPIESVQIFLPNNFPYIPGLLSFREIPAILKALSQIKTSPDLLMVDGQGIAHPRKMGIATHLGLILDLPSIGIAKSLLAGNFSMPGLKKGEISPLLIKKEQIGVVLRSKDNVKPLFISPGHKISIKTSLEITLKCLTKYRLPEPTRLADKFSKLQKT